MFCSTLYLGGGFPETSFYEQFHEDKDKTKLIGYSTQFVSGRHFLEQGLIALD